MTSFPHRHLNLRTKGDAEDENPHRPPLSVWAENIDGQNTVSVCINALFGQQARYLEMTTDEARKLARLLTRAADEIAAVVAEGRPADCGP